MKTPREPRDNYATPEWQTKALLNYVYPTGFIFEPCAGAGAMANVLRHLPGSTILTADLYHEAVGVQEFDATDLDAWGRAVPGAVDWTITNPPFKAAFDILKCGMGYSKIGVALILRTTFLEPTKTRGTWMSENPPDLRIVMPRTQYRPPNKDTATTEWMVWYNRKNAEGIRIVTREESEGYGAEWPR